MKFNEPRSCAPGRVWKDYSRKQQCHFILVGCWESPLRSTCSSISDRFYDGEISKSMTLFLHHGNALNQLPRAIYSFWNMIAARDQVCRDILQQELCSHHHKNSREVWAGRPNWFCDENASLPLGGYVLGTRFVKVIMGPHPFQSQVCRLQLEDGYPSASSMYEVASSRISEVVGSLWCPVASLLKVSVRLHKYLFIWQPAATLNNFSLCIKLRICTNGMDWKRAIMINYCF